MRPSTEKVAHKNNDPNFIAVEYNHILKYTKNTLTYSQYPITNSHTPPTCFSLYLTSLSPPPPPPSMEDSQAQHTIIPKETALQTLNTIIQLHFEKTLEKKKSVDSQKKHLWKLFQQFFLFLSIIFAAITTSPKLQCKHCWAPITLLSLAHWIFYVSVAQTLRCINGLKYQRRCHKLTLGVATDKLRQLKLGHSLYGGEDGGDGGGGYVNGEDFEVVYQEPSESYFGKFKRNWALYFGFLIFIYGFMVSSCVVILCF